MSITQLEFVDLLVASMGKENISNAQVYFKKIETLSIVADASTSNINEQEEFVMVAQGCFESYFTKLVLREYDEDEIKTYIETMKEVALENKLEYDGAIINNSVINRTQSDFFKNAYIQKTMQTLITQTISENSSIKDLEIVYTKQITTINIKNINNKKMSDSYAFESIQVILSGQDDTHIVHEYGYDFSNLSLIVANAVEKLTMKLCVQPLQGGCYTTVFSANVVANLLAQYVPLFLADRKESFVEKKGYLFTDARISIMDKPNFMQGRYNRVFDDLGFFTTETLVVKKGMFCDALQTQKTAQQFKVQETANNFYDDTYTDILALPTNLIVSPGNSELDAILKKLDNGIYINELDFANSTFCNETGDFTMIASGWLYTQKARVGGIVSVKIASNLYHIFKSIESIGDSLDYSNCNDYFVAAPCLKVKKVEFI